MESLMYHDYRQQPIASGSARDQYCEYLARLEAMIADQEDVVSQARASSDAGALASAAPRSGGCSRSGKASKTP